VEETRARFWWLLALVLNATAVLVAIFLPHAPPPPPSAAIPSFKQVSQPLYSFEFESYPVSIQETQRNSNTSWVLVKAKPTPEPDKGLGMLMVMACQQMAADRGAKYFVPLQRKKTGDDVELLVGFSDSAAQEPAKVFADLSDLLPGLKWMPADPWSRHFEGSEKRPQGGK
jgi:hypothetical protein